MNLPREYFLALNRKLLGTFLTTCQPPDRELDTSREVLFSE